MVLPLTDEEIMFLRLKTRKARPYRPEEEEAADMYFDKPDARLEATMAMVTLQNEGLWTEEDERETFGEKKEE